jgi:hypothetical protein
VKVAQSIWAGTGVPAPTLDAADETIKDFILGYHKAELSGSAVEKELHNELLERYSTMLHEATVHTHQASRNQSHLKKVSAEMKS